MRTRVTYTAKITNAMRDSNSDFLQSDGQRAFLSKLFLISNLQFSLYSSFVLSLVMSSLVDPLPRNDAIMG